MSEQESSQSFPGSEFLRLHSLLMWSLYRSHLILLAVSTSYQYGGVFSLYHRAMMISIICWRWWCNIFTNRLLFPLIWNLSNGRSPDSLSKSMSLIVGYCVRTDYCTYEAWLIPHAIHHRKSTIRGMFFLSLSVFICLPNDVNIVLHSNDQFHDYNPKWLRNFIWL